MSVLRGSYIVRTSASISMLGIEVLLHLAKRADQIGQAFERVVLALHRDDHRIGGGEAVHREHVERRRAVDHGEIVVRAVAC